ncbi:hypothetical protein [Legionella micdadei]|uniref:Uncharacterized protein n=1 Tax=Legionella micdadei TaxID=451 RepID=A0A098GER5_LEGMI|nr:hypothetical protein [Legionella micdadei]KTD27543.1 hypothetical protein Lmic_1863 [Legionella micdadei]CEG60968.1 protein of unknown function [Legionella micdadei]SCY69718.1 hypothetical protein SAMN02982997_02539 [Legionella micdadei]
MAFTFYGYQPERPMEQPLNNVIKNILGGYTEASKARYLQPTLEEELQKAKLFNKWYEPNIKSEIGLRGAHAGLLGEQKRGAQIENQFLPEFKKAQIEQLKATADKARLLQMIREQLLGGGSGNILNSPSQPIKMYQGQGMPAFSEAPQSNEVNRPSINSNAPGYAQAAIAQQALGLGMPKIVDVNGKQMAISPFGIFDTGIQGLTAEEKAFQSGLGKARSEFYQNSVNAFNTLGNQDLALNELKNSVENNPEFRNVTGKIQKPLSEWFGTPAQKQLLGVLQTASGEITLQIASSLKGAWTGRDQNLVNSIKPNPQDFPDVLIGKLRAQLLINSALKERAKLQAQLVEQGMSTLKASELAAKATPLDKFEPVIKGLIKHKPPITFDEAKQEYRRRLTARKLNG